MPIVFFLFVYTVYCGVCETIEMKERMQPLKDLMAQFEKKK